MSKRKRTRGRAGSHKVHKAPGRTHKPTRSEKQAAQQAEKQKVQPTQAEVTARPVGTNAKERSVGDGRRWPDWLAWFAFAVILLFYLVLKSFSFHWQVGDENIYFYMAWATLDHEALPYRDYFFAHPPLHLLVGIPVFGLLGFGPVAARVIPVGATLVSASMLFLLARREIGRLAAVATAFSFLTAFSLLRASTHWTGINLAVMWLTAGLFFLLRRRPATAGVMFALGVCTGNYALPAAAMAGLLAVLQGRRAGLRYLVGFSVPWLSVQLVCLIAGGSAYIDGVYRYHFLKPTKPGASRDMFVRVFGDNFWLHLGCLLAPLLAWGDRFLARSTGLCVPDRPRTQSGQNPLATGWLWCRAVLLLDGPRGLARVGALWALGYLLFLFVIPRVFPFYFLLMFSGLALACGFCVDRLVGHALGLVRSFVRRDRAWLQATGIVAGALVFLGVAHLVRVPLQRKLLPTYVRPRDKPMKWSDSPLPVNAILRWCCWDDVAKAGAAYGTVQELLYHESRYFEQAESLARFVRQNSRPEQTLFGDSSTAGLIALLSGRRLAGDCADTNTLRFSSGVTSANALIERLDTPELAFVLVQLRRVRTDRSGRKVLRYQRFAALTPFYRWLDDRFRVAHQVRDRTKGTFLLLGRKTNGGSG